MSTIHTIKAGRCWTRLNIELSKNLENTELDIYDAMILSYAGRFIYILLYHESSRLISSSYPVSVIFCWQDAVLS
jgi:hypothetical protein